MDEKHIEALENDDVLFCNKCETQITEETNYDWKYEDGETKEFSCPNCGATHKIVISRPIEKIVYILDK
jgi:RNase P subunit RPR2